MSVNSKDKGARYERHIADAFTQAGYVAHRTAQYCGNTGDAPDVSGCPYLHIECKAYKATEWSEDWMQQAIRDSQGKAIPVVIHKVDYGKDKVTLTGKGIYEMLKAYMENEDDLRVTMYLDDFIKLYREYEADRYLGGQNGGA